MATPQDRTRGRRAEAEIAKLLNRLPQNDFLVAYDVKYKYGNVDHLVWRRDGTIYLIETKSHKGFIETDGNRIFLNGYRPGQNWMGQIHCGIRWLKRFLRAGENRPAWLVAVLVFPFARVKARGEVGKVNVLDGTQLVPFLRNYRVRLTPQSRRQGSA